jgi:hypothetical protein
VGGEREQNFGRGTKLAEVQELTKVMKRTKAYLTRHPQAICRARSRTRSVRGGGNWRTVAHVGKRPESKDTRSISLGLRPQNASSRALAHCWPPQSPGRISLLSQPHLLASRYLGETQSQYRPNYVPSVKRPRLCATIS